MEDRYLIPDSIDPEKVTIFSIMDKWEMERRPRYDLDRFAEAFGLTFNQNSNQFMQIFGYKVATIEEMEGCAGVDVGGYHFYCWKSPALVKGRLLLTDGVNQQFSEESFRETIGWGFHTSRYYPHAVEEAMYVTHREALKQAQTISQTTGREIVEIMPPLYIIPFRIL